MDNYLYIRDLHCTEEDDATEIIPVKEPKNLVVQ